MVRKPAASEPPSRARVSSKGSNESPRSRDIVNPWSNHEQIPNPSKLPLPIFCASWHPSPSLAFPPHRLTPPRPPRRCPPPCRPASISIIRNLFFLFLLLPPSSGPSSSTPYSLLRGHTTHPSSSSLPFAVVWWHKCFFFI
ncbi:hypothetical protein BDP55DRAFT_231892 [Colletotrichum godetiae]|uniref:Uncharacterized protein n=1 Tax=Colletotrichum godetiae TaxID=1209918 RepID=A0AAJ0AGZ4_9PEZI|nr:uncharacterized protein BDP55DRAFT_231892 [Colletotrichum godetiae]KAK1673079.1 hypothetical protein BDP55DRAFT_231892 [Colletotrichum godetiae]